MSSRAERVGTSHRALHQTVFILCAAMVLFAEHVGAQAAKRETGLSKDLEQTAGAAGLAGSLPESSLTCQKIVAMVKKSKAELELIEDLEKSLKWFGPAIATAEAAMMAYNGRTGDAVQRLEATAFDAAVCSSFPNACPAWAIGRTFGEIVNIAAPKLFKSDRKLDEIIEDFYIANLYDRQPSMDDMRKIQEATARGKAKREAILREAKTCNDPARSKDGVTEVLDRSRPPARLTPMTPKVASRPAECDVLKNTAASEALSAKDPAAYDELLLRCL